MNEVGSAAALVLAAVFAWAGAAKAVRPGATATAFRALGVPAAPVTARAVPMAELTVAAALVMAPRAGGLAAIGLLAGFSCLLGRALIQGTAAPCACFGSAAADPVSGADLVRNLMLATLAALALRPATLLVPSIEAVVLVTTLALSGAVVLALLRLGARIGSLFDPRPVPDGPRP